MLFSITGLSVPRLNCQHLILTSIDCLCCKSIGTVYVFISFLSITSLQPVNFQARSSHRRRAVAAQLSTVLSNKLRRAVTAVYPSPGISYLLLHFLKRFISRTFFPSKLSSTVFIALRLFHARFLSSFPRRRTGRPHRNKITINYPGCEP